MCKDSVNFFVSEENYCFFQCGGENAYFLTFLCYFYFHVNKINIREAVFRETY